MKCSLFCLFAVLAYTLAVVGGTSTTIDFLPWNLSLRHNSNHVCGAALITANRALTAANCYNGQQGDHPLHYTVLAKSTTRIPNASGVIVAVTSFIRHPQYNSAAHTNDIAVLYLQNSLTFGTGIQPIPIPIQNAPITVGSYAIVSGWGSTIVGVLQVLTNNLQYKTVPVVSNAACSVAYPNRITSGEVCADGRGACVGDNGAPLVAYGTLIGIKSWGVGCGILNRPDVFSRVSHNANFINSHL